MKEAPWFPFFPGLTMTSTILALNMVSETPRLRVIVSLREALRQACPERSRRAQDKLCNEAILF